ncbi:MAG: sulfotransferase [Myxococcota bacterium]|nr:sulfotransferase [Myxococcota bacterium]
MERFVVGTGRCGSTLLSRMLDEAPGCLGVFEFFNGLDANERFDPRPISGAALGEMISREQPFVTAVLRRGYRVDEITYPFADDPEGPAPRGRHRRGEPLPWILVSMLPRLTRQPDALFEELGRFTAGLPDQPPRDHYLALFGWLCKRLERSWWIERSGSSIDYAADLIRLYPEARFVHLHRLGPEVALSMREHHAYRLPIALLYDAALADGRRVSELPPLDLEAPPTRDDTISRILEARPPAEYFGRYWADQVLRGQPALDRLPPGQLLEVPFETLVSRPRDVLTEIAEFFEIETGAGGGGWIPRAASLVAGVPPARSPRLSSHERSQLLEACAPGAELMGRS